jgi:tetratricopeptide (TPR) repeat protein
MDKIDAIVLGSFIKAGERFATDVKILDVQTKKLLKSVNTQGKGAESILSNQIDYLSDEISAGLGLSAGEIDAVKFRIANVSTKSLEAYKNFLTGRSLIWKYYIEEAIPYLEKAVQLDSNFAVAYMYLGNAYDFLINKEESKKTISKAKALVDYATDKEKIFIEALYQSRIKGNYEKALQITKEGVKKYPKEKLLYLWVGKYYREQVDYNKAIESLNTALELDPTFKEAINLLVYTHADLGNYEKAIEYIKTYVSANPNEANPYDSMGDLYFKMGDFDNAIGSYNKAVEIKPGFFSFWKSSIILSLREEYDRAEKWMRKQLSDSYSVQSRIFALFGLAHLNFWRGNYDESIHYADEVQKIINQTVFGYWEMWIYYFKGWIYYYKNQYDKSLSFFKYNYNIETTFQSGNLTPEAYFQFFKGIINIKKEEIDSARSNLNSINELINLLNEKDKTNIIYHYKMLYGELLIYEDSLDKAEEVFMSLPEVRHIDLNSQGMFKDLSTPFPKDGLAKVYDKQGKIELAISEYEKLTSSDPLARDLKFIFPLYRYRLARLYEENGQIKKAVAEYEKFFKFWKNADKDSPELIDTQNRLKKLKDM